MTKKLLPIGLTSLAQIRQEDRYYYVDKTPLIIELLNTSSYVFLSRPRRFGKSLTIDTIAELFSGNKSLFEGLYAEQHWDWEDTYPVIRLSFAGEPERGNLAALRASIEDSLKRNADTLEVELVADDLATERLGIVFQDLIYKTVQKYGKQVVVLIDEYDKPIIDNLNDAEIALEIRNILRSLYSQLKDLAPSIRFAMLTGVSKFGQMSLFSGLNHLKDITIDARYSALCGYTQAELEEVFAPELVDVDLGTLREWYNGYNWTGESVYNPFDILLFLDKGKKYQSYWISTGGNTSFLYNIIQQQHFSLLSMMREVSSIGLLSSMDVGTLSPIPVMFQTGYLTIDQEIQETMGIQYTLKFPNKEVRLAFNQGLWQWYASLDMMGLSEQQSDLIRALRQGDVEVLRQVVSSAFAGLPHDWYRKNEIARYEGHWASSFYMFFASCCEEVIAEEASSKGRVDLVVIERGNVYIFEFKMSHAGDAESALAQVQEKRYADKYRASAKQIIEIGVSFDAQTKALEFAVAD
ncbi:ATP-binding protein [Pelistega europaea]|uniref:ATP-binding protein n=1 Tax=Pelistega europaea TaxID=106147 RepID=A0A7Y4P5B3_9BURK|nr:ATP-binding protein [Pelistega europaea]NOL49618.1 ATP-binding protein [Pelistega europaea]